MTTPSSHLPRNSRLIALLLSQYVDEADKASIGMLTEFAYRYTHQVLSDAIVYAEHSAQSNKRDQTTSVSLKDVRLAIQAKTEQSFSSPWPKEFLLSLAASLNKEPLPAIQEAYGVRLPPESERLTAVNFDLVHKDRPIRTNSRIPQDFAGSTNSNIDMDVNAMFDGQGDDDEDFGMMNGDGETEPQVNGQMGASMNSMFSGQDEDQDQDQDQQMDEDDNYD